MRHRHPTSNARWIATVSLATAVLTLVACRSPNHAATYNVYDRSTHRPWLKRLDDGPDTAETQLQRLDSRIEHLLY